MKWIKILSINLLSIIIVGVISSIVFISQSAIFSDNHGLGEPVWHGFLAQVQAFTYISVVYMIISLFPISILVEIFIKKNKLTFLFFTSLSVLYFTYVYVWGGFLEGIAAVFAGAGAFCGIQYLTRKLT